jgi:hypothetical protein
MELFTTGAPVFPSRVSDVLPVSGIAPATSRCSASYAQGVPFTGLARTRAVAADPVASGVPGQISPEPGASPAPMSQRKRQHVDLDPHRPRPSGGCG